MDVSGAVLSIEKTSPVKLPFPTPAPPSGLLLPSTIESLSTRFKPSVPLPLPVITVTVYTLPGPAGIEKMDAPVSPVVTRLKSLASTPETFSLNVTVQATLTEFVGLMLDRTMETTVGTEVSTVTVHV